MQNLMVALDTYYANQNNTKRSRYVLQLLLLRGCECCGIVLVMLLVYHRYFCDDEVMSIFDLISYNKSNWGLYIISMSNWGFMLITRRLKTINRVQDNDMAMYAFSSLYWTRSAWFDHNPFCLLCPSLCIQISGENLKFQHYQRICHKNCTDTACLVYLWLYIQ